MTAAPDATTVERPESAELLLPEVPWVTVVWDDPVNLMSYVSFVFTDYFHYPKSKARKLMMQVHTEGKAAVSSGSREEMERDVQAMHSYGLWATLQGPRLSTFRSHRKGSVYAQLPPYAARLLVNLTRQLVELLRDGEPAEVHGEDPLEALLTLDDPRETPDDPALRRLLPDAHVDDAEAAAEFRRYTERGLRDSKVADAGVVLATLALVDDDDAEAVEFLLDPAQARAWMRCLTALRLTLAERLGVTADDEDYWEGLDESDDRLPVYEIYGWLGYLLESLIDAVRR